MKVKLITIALLISALSLTGCVDKHKHGRKPTHVSVKMYSDDSDLTSNSIIYWYLIALGTNDGCPCYGYSYSAPRGAQPTSMPPASSVSFTRFTTSPMSSEAKGVGEREMNVDENEDLEKAIETDPEVEVEVAEADAESTEADATGESADAGGGDSGGGGGE